jgi:hypothetical protein
MTEIGWSTAEPEFENWPDLVKAMSTLKASGWIYRGLPDYRYDSVSKLERTLSARQTTLAGYQLREEENRAIGFFKRRARQILSSTPSDSDLLGWLSLMQHYGAPTRLTDWSVSPFVACYFAYERPLDKEDAALWMLNANACRNSFGSPVLSQLYGPVDHIGAIPTVQYDMAGNPSKVYEGRSLTIESRAEVEAKHIRHVIENEVIIPLPLPILRPDSRMTAQQACFVCLGKLGCDPPILSILLNPEAYPESNIEKQLPSILVSQPGESMTRYLVPLIKKIRLRREWRDEALATLALFNVSADTLFPGLDGAGRATEVFVSRDKQEIENSFWNNLVL